MNIALIGYMPFNENEQGEGKILSTHNTVAKLEDAWHKYKGKLCLDWCEFKKAQKGEDVKTNDNGMWEVLQ